MYTSLRQEAATTEKFVAEGVITRLHLRKQSHWDLESVEDAIDDMRDYIAVPSWGCLLFL